MIHGPLDTVIPAMADHRDRGVIALLTRLAKTAYRRAAEDDMGMSMREYVVLTYIDDHGGAPQSDLREAMHLDPNNLVLLLNDLEGEGLIERRRDVEDRRRHIVEVTRRGVKARERAEQALESIEEDVLGALSQSERATLRDLLARALQSASDPAAPEREAAAARRGD